MTTQPEALRLADELDAAPYSSQCTNDAAAELRRLHEENRLLHERHHDDNVEYTRVLAQRDALLEAAQDIVDFIGGPVEAKRPDVFFLRINKARAAIKAVEEKA